MAAVGGGESVVSVLPIVALCPFVDFVVVVVGEGMLLLSSSLIPH